MSLFNEPTFWFTLISTFCAGYTVISNFLNRHKKLIITVNWVCVTYQNQMNISFHIYNPSTENCSITNVAIDFVVKEYNAANYPDILATRSESTAFSSPLPVNIPPRQAVAIILPFKYLPDGLTDKDNQNILFTIGNKKVGKRFFIGQKRINSEQLVRRLNQQLE